jgi:hypothetical protein
MARIHHMLESLARLQERRHGAAAAVAQQARGAQGNLAASDFGALLVYAAFYLVSLA